LYFIMAKKNEINIMTIFQGVTGKEYFDMLSKIVRVKIQKTSKRFDLLYYINSEDGEKEMIIRNYQNLINKKNIRTISFYPNFHNPINIHNSANEQSNDGFIYGNVINAIKNSPVAIAFITKEDRNAIEAGNLWLEIGLFLGIKNSHCYLYIDEEIRSENSEIQKNNMQFNIISDLKNYSYLPFNKNKIEELYKNIVWKVSDIFLEFSNNKISQFKKDKIVFSFRNKTWDIDKSYDCPVRNSFCERRLTHLSFSSELISINIEMELILVYKSLFSQLRKIAAELKYYVPEDIEVYLKTKVTKDSLENSAYNDKEKIRLIEIMTNNDKIENGFSTTLDEVNLAYTDFLEKSEILFSIGEYKLLGYNNKDKSYSSHSSDNSNEDKLKHRALYFDERIKYIKLKEELNSTVDDLFRILELDCAIRKSNMTEYKSNYSKMASILLDNYKILMDIEIILKNWE